MGLPTPIVFFPGELLSWVPWKPCWSKKGNTISQATILKQTEIKRKQNSIHRQTSFSQVETQSFKHWRRICQLAQGRVYYDVSAHQEARIVDQPLYVDDIAGIMIMTCLPPRTCILTRQNLQGLNHLHVAKPKHCHCGQCMLLELSNFLKIKNGKHIAIATKKTNQVNWHG